MLLFIVYFYYRVISKRILQRVLGKEYLFQNLEQYYLAELTDKENVFLNAFEKKIDELCKNGDENKAEIKLYSQALSTIFETFNVCRGHLVSGTSLR